MVILNNCCDGELPEPFLTKRVSFVAQTCVVCRSAAFHFLEGLAPNGSRVALVRFQTADPNPARVCATRSQLCSIGRRPAKCFADAGPLTWLPHCSVTVTKATNFNAVRVAQKILCHTLEVCCEVLAYRSKGEFAFEPPWWHPEGHRVPDVAR
jgi:hypothetical protein